MLDSVKCQGDVKEEKKARKCWSAGRRGGLAKKVTFKYTLRRSVPGRGNIMPANALSWELFVQGTVKWDPFSPLSAGLLGALPALQAGGQAAWGCDACWLQVGGACLFTPAAPALLYPCPAFIPLFSSIAAFCLAGCVLRVASCHFSTYPFLGSPSPLPPAPSFPLLPCLWWSRSLSLAPARFISFSLSFLFPLSLGLFLGLSRVSVSPSF